MIKASRRIFVAVILVLFVAMSSAATRSLESYQDINRLPERQMSEFIYPTRSLDADPPSDSDALSLREWWTETVGSGGGRKSLVLDTHGNPHIAYWSKAGLGYAYYDGTEWYTEIVNSADAQFVSMALDSHDNPHISYTNDVSGDWVLYARKEGSSWQIESTNLYGQWPSLALDSQDRPHIACYERWRDLRYAYYDGSTWHYEVVDAGAGNERFGRHAKLALDAADHPHIAYQDAYRDFLRYAYYDGSNWHIEVVDSRNGAGEGISLALDTNGHPHIGYLNWVEDHQYYAYYDGSDWLIEKAVDDVYNGEYLSLALDHAGNPHMSYDGNNNDLKYAYRDAAGWHLETVDVGFFCMISSIAIGHDGRPRIAYTKGAHVKYATKLHDYEDWAKLAFAQHSADAYHVCTAKGDGSNPVCALDPFTDTTPVLNRGATEVAFASWRDGNSEIYKMEVDGSDQTRLTWNTTGDYLPSWSPNGGSIAFYSDRDGNAEIYTMKTDGSDQTRLTFETAWDGHPAWSPAGDKIAFVSQRSGQYELWIMDVDGSNQQQLSFGLGGVGYPDWSPDGSQIAFSHDANGDGWLDIAIINADGTGLYHPIGYSSAYRDSLAPDWSPDGAHLAFGWVRWLDATRSNYSQAYVKAADLQGVLPETKLETNADWWPDWQTIDTVPPVSSISAPVWSDVPTFTVEWSGDDTGAAGLCFYDVQYQDGTGGAWTDWLTGTIKTASVFSGDQGHVYYFRSRARDCAGNLESYPDTGCAVTHVTRYRLTGRVLGNRGQPIYLATLDASPSAMNTASSGPDGDFALYFDMSGSYDLQVSHNGFGTLPPMSSFYVTDTYTMPTFYLPPADDQVVNGGFESAGTGWTFLGEVTPTITTTAHTGISALMLGGQSLPDQLDAGYWCSEIAQEVVISSTVESGTLSLVYQVVDANPLSDTLRVSLTSASDGVTYTLPLTPMHGWVHHWVESPDFGETTVTVRIVWCQGEDTRAAGVILDEISLGSAIEGVYNVYFPIGLRDEP